MIKRRLPSKYRRTDCVIRLAGASGSHVLLSYYDAGDRLVPICGLPGCAMYNKRTIFDIVLPRLMARDMIYADELAGLGEGGLCLNCDVCTFPNCGFGKGF